MKRDREKVGEEWRKRTEDRGNWRVLIGKVVQESEKKSVNTRVLRVLNKHRVMCLYKH